MLIIAEAVGIAVRDLSVVGNDTAAAEIYAPSRVAVVGVGNLFIADSGNQRIRKVSPAGTITTVAGNGTFWPSGDGGPATSAQFCFAGPTGVAGGGRRKLFLAGHLYTRNLAGDPAGADYNICGDGRFFVLC